jgi:hypothetical protein
MSVSFPENHVNQQLLAPTWQGSINAMGAIAIKEAYDSVSPMVEPASYAATFLSSSYSVYTTLCGKALDGAQKVVKATTKFWKDLDFTDKLGAAGKFIGGAVGVVALYSCYKGWEKIFASNQAAKQIDGALTVVESTGNLAKATVAIGEGLQKATYLSSHALTWTTAISAFGLILSAASSLSYAKKTYESYKLTKEISALKETHGTYQGALIALEKLQGIKKNTGLKKAHLASRIQAQIEKAATLEMKEEVAKQIYESLKTRVNSRITSNALICLASTISIVGSAILLATPAAPAAGFGFLAVSGAVHLGEYFYNRHHDKKFEELLNI